jgi:hypothetical protein
LIEGISAQTKEAAKAASFLSAKISGVLRDYNVEISEGSNFICGRKNTKSRQSRLLVFSKSGFKRD